MIIYLLPLGIYLILVFLSIFYNQKILFGLSGIAFLFPITQTDQDMIIILLSIIGMLFHFVIAFFPINNDNDYF